MSDFNLKVGAKVDTSTIQKELNAKEYKVTATIVTKGGTEYEKTVRKLKDTTGGLYETTELLNKSTGETTTKFTKATSTVKETSNAIQTASKHTKTLGEDFLITAGKVAKFGAITAVIGLFTKTMYEAVESVKEMDASLTEIKKVSDLSGAGLQEYTDQAFAMARELSTTASTVTDAVAQFVQAGFSLEESQGLAKYSIMLQGIADETMDVETATNFLTSTMKAFNMNATDAEKIISSVNEVSNEYAITSNDLTENIGKVAGVAGIAGVSFEELLGLMVSSVEKTRNASKSANAFKSIFINLQQMSTDGTMPKLQKQFEEFGLSMTDQNGAIKDAYTLLGELSEAYKDVSASTDVDKQNKMRTLLEDIGGKHNYNVLVSSLSGFESAVNATKTALGSAGSAQEEFQKSLDSIGKKAEATKGALMELAWGEGGLQGLIKGLLDAGTGILRFADDTNALNVILVTTSLILLSKIVPAVASSVKSLYTLVRTVTSNTVAMEAMGVSVNTTKIALGGLVAILGIVYMAMSAYNASQERAMQSALDSARALDEYTASSQNTIGLLNDENATRESLISTIETLGGKYSDEELALKNVNDLRQDGIDLLYEEAKAKAQETIKETGGQYEKSKKVLEDPYTVHTKIGGVNLGVGDFKFQSSAKALEFYNEKIDKYNKKIDEGTKLSTVQTALLSYYEDVVKKINEDIDNATNIINGRNSAQEILNMTEEEYISKQKEALATSEETARVNGMTTEQFEAQAEALGMSTDEYARYLEAQKSSTSNAEEANNAFSDSISQVGSISDSYSELTSAVDEYNSSGALSFETLERLMSLGGDYLSMLSMENGQLVLNKDGFDAIANAKIDDAEAMAYNSAMAQLDALALDQAGNSASTATPKFSGAGVEAYNSGINALNAVGNWQAYWKSVLNEKGVTSSPETLRIGNNLKSQLTMLESARKSIGKYTTATNGSAKANSGATKATKDNTDAIKKQKEALEKLKSNYERAINYIKKKLDEDIDKLEEDKDKALEAVDAKIDALDKQRDAEEKYWDDKIDALDEQNDALKTQIELEQKLEAVAKAKSSKVMIYKDGQWQYGQDESAVSSAEQDLYDFQENLKREQQVKDLEAMKDKILANLDAQIDGWEAYKDNLEKNYDSQIDYLKKYKENFENMVNSYSDAQDKLLAEQLTGINFEKGNWDTRLGNLQTFVAQYNSILSQLDKFDDSDFNTGGGGSSGGGGGGSSSSGGKVVKPYTVFQILGSYSTSGQASSNIGRLNGDGMMSYGGAYVVYKKTSGQYDSSSKASNAVSSLVTSSQGRKQYGFKQFASGISSIGADQVAIVGDDPNKNQELVAGSMASGKLMNLAKGTRVIDNGNTKLLGGLVNAFSKSGFIDSTAGMTTANTNNVSNNNGMTINGNITVVANNPNEFENYFKRYNSNMLQKSFAT